VRIFLTGRTGQLGGELLRALAPLGEVVAVDRAALDLARPELIASTLRAARPDVIVNAAAYTAVERAEREPELARAINARAPGVMAEEARRLNALLVHYSTDYVFDGTKASPYVEDDPPNPLNVYGKTKLEGEQAVRQAGARGIVLRTSWIFSARGRNFLLAILGKARLGNAISVVADQRGAPTSAAMLAEATALVVAESSSGRAPDRGLYHVAAAGSTSWHGFAQAIVRGAGLDVPVIPVASAAYGGVLRPRNSMLDTGRAAAAFDIRLPDWKVGLESCLEELRASNDLPAVRAVEAKRGGAEKPHVP
jgi:dTDP-4-dehydrorhamnose reductase